MQRSGGGKGAALLAGVAVVILAWSLGVALFTGVKSAKAMVKALAHPMILSAGAGILVMVFRSRSRNFWR